MTVQVITLKKYIQAVKPIKSIALKEHARTLRNSGKMPCRMSGQLPSFLTSWPSLPSWLLSLLSWPSSPSLVLRRRQRPFFAFFMAFIAFMAAFIAITYDVNLEKEQGVVTFA